MKKSSLTLICLLCIFALFACNNTPQQLPESTESILEETTTKIIVSESTETTTNTITETEETEATQAPTTQTTQASTTETTEEITTKAETTEEITTREETTEEITTEEESTEEITTEETTTEEVTTEETTTEEATTEEATTEETTTEEETTEEITVPHIAIEASETKLTSGEEFTVTVSIKENPGIYSLTFTLPIDNNVFEFVSVSTEGSVCPPAGICQYDTNSSTYKFNGHSSSPFRNITDDGQIVTITLRVKSGVSAGKYTLSVLPDDKNIINVDYDLVAFIGTTKTFTVSN